MLENPILKSISNWFKRVFADPNTVSLFMALLIGLVVLQLFGKILLPVLISIVVAYLLLPIVKLLTRWKFPHLLAVIIVYLLFLGLVVFAIIDIIPSLWKQMVNLVNEIPKAFDHSQAWFNTLPQRYPRILSESQLQRVFILVQDQSAKIGQDLIKVSFSALPSVFQVILYLILVPLLVLFMLKDRQPILDWFSQYLPSHRGLVLEVGSQVNRKIGAYVKGRVIEIIIVGVATSITFSLFGLQYAVLLGSLVGLSVLVPYIGAIVVTVPVVIVGLMQWGFGAHFIYAIVAYALIITLDANLLVPLLFSEVMELHPIVIILSVIVFGGIWGFWGVFFAIPLATLCNVILLNWPSSNNGPKPATPWHKTFTRRRSHNDNRF
jgi:putative permease